MMKKILFLALIGLAAFTSVAQISFSKKITVDSIEYSVNINKRTATLVDGTSRHGPVVIPSSITDDVYDYTVTEIGESAFAKSNVTLVTIPNSVTSIGISAFFLCGKLTKVNLGAGVKSIGKSAFLNCYALKEYNVSLYNDTFSSNGGVLFNKTRTTLIAYPNAKGATYQIPSTINTIGPYAFIDCTGLTQVTIPNSVTTIEKYAFYGCSGLTQVTIPNSVTTIAELAFCVCSGLTQVTIPNSVTTIEGWAFAYSQKLISVTIGTGLNSLGENAFFNCPALNQFYVRHDNGSFASVDGVLFNKAGTKLIAYPIAKGSTSYIIPATVETIGAGAFGYSTGLTQVTIPNSVTTIFGNAFYNCSSLKLVCCGRKEPIAIDSSVFGGVSLSEAVLVVLDKQAYASADVWKDFGTIIGLDNGLKGDLNEDGKVDVSDVTSLMGIILQ